MYKSIHSIVYDDIHTNSLDSLTRIATAPSEIDDGKSVCARERASEKKKNKDVESSKIHVLSIFQ